MQIGLCGAPIEDHRGEGGGTTWRYLPDGAAVGIPLRSLDRPRRGQRARRRPLLLGDPRRACLDPLDGAVHGDGPGGRDHGRAGRGRVGPGRRRPRRPGRGRPRAPPARRRDPRALETRRRGARDDVRADRPRRHRPGRPRGHVRPRAPGHRRRPPGRDAPGLRPRRRRPDGARGRGRRSRSGCARSSMPCPATAAATPSSWPSCRAGPGSTSSPRPGSTTSATTDRTTGA